MEDVIDDFRADMRSAIAETEAADEARTVDVAATEVKEQTAEQQPASQERDTSGRFAPKTPAQAAEPAGGASPAEKEPAQAVATQQAETQPAAAPTRAPVSWTPEAREEWASMSPRLQQEVIRREREITETLRTTADARRFHAEVNQIIAPYAHMIQAENSTPQQAIQNFFQTAAMLRVGTPQNKAALVAQIVSQYGIDVEMLDNALAGAPQRQTPQGGQDVDAAVQRALAPILAPIQQQRAQQEQQTTAQLEEEATTFMNDPANEFAFDVKEDMADILELAARRGVKISLQDAYSRAILHHPTISGIVQRRKQQADAAKETEAAKRARNAAASLSSDGAPGQGSEGGEKDDLRSVIMAAASSAGRR